MHYRFPASTNWIRLSLDANKAVFEYEVKFEPPIDILNLRFSLVNSLREKIGIVKSFDGHGLWLPYMLPHEVCLLPIHPCTGHDISVIHTGSTNVFMYVVRTLCTLFEE